ncbi:glutathione S-transferase family protein [Nevskia sp.]|uniref:glutathione S-transferase family protein n=1 Tax=Nevskia sp. TaxID=1929292 RepID=UPI0025E16973|nr:glutathione S-transferase family protein [Nevskia sp.]
MSELVLHHYPLSPYSEKIRAIFGYKGLAWKSVETPILMPKPDLLPLTGGYRKAPVLQIGRDIYCDTALIARVIDRLQPAPPLLPNALKASCAAFAAIEQTLFFAAVPTVFQPAGLKVLLERMGPELMERFSKDRAALFTGGAASRPGPEFGKTHFLPLINSLDQQLAAMPFLLGDAPTLADFCMFHPVWFIRSNAGVAPQLDAFKSLMAWFERIRALGHGSASVWTAAEAIAHARATPEVQPPDGPLLEPEGVRVGSSVTVAATDYGVDAVVGRLIHASVFEIVIKRTDERAGEVIVHFPRAGFRVTPA